MAGLPRLILLVTGLAVALIAANIADAVASSAALYVTDYEAAGAVVPVSLVTLTAGTAITSHIGSFPGAVAISPDATRAFSVGLSGSFSVIDTSSNTASLFTAGVFTSPGSAAVSPDGSTLYIGNVNDDTIAVVNLGPMTVNNAPITVGSGPWGIAFSPDGRSAYVANNAGTVSVIDTASLTVTTTISTNLPSDPCGVTVTPDGTKAVVIGGCNAGTGGVSIIDTATNTATAVTALGTHQFPAEAMSPDGKTAYVYDNSTGDIWQLNTATGALPATPLVTGAAGIEGLAISPDGSALYATRLLSGSVSKIATADGAVTPISPVTTKPWADAVTPDQAPRAALSTTVAPAGSATILSAAATTTNDGGPATYKWDFGDGGSTTTTAPNVSHVYDTEGDYSPTVTVTDDQGCSTRFVYTGQTASCNGSALASAATSITVPAPTSTPPPGNPPPPGMTPPDTTITKAKVRTKRAAAMFKFSATGGASGFRCQLKRKHHRAKPFTSCESPVVYKHLRSGRYKFLVAAFNDAGADPTPAKSKFKLR